MGEFLAELLGSLLEGLIPERASNLFVRLLMRLSGVVFVGFAFFCGYQLVTGRGPLVAAVAVLFFVALSGLCFRLAAKGFRSGGGLDTRNK